MRAALYFLVAALLLAGCIEDTRPNAEACSAPSIELSLSLTADALTPGNPAVCRDQEVTLRIESQVDGIFHIHGYDEAVPATEVRAGETLPITFEATRSGQFPIELHPEDDPRGVDVGIFTVHEP